MEDFILYTRVSKLENSLDKLTKDHLDLQKLVMKLIEEKKKGDDDGR